MLFQPKMVLQLGTGAGLVEKLCDFFKLIQLSKSGAASIAKLSFLYRTGFILDVITLSHSYKTITNVFFQINSTCSIIVLGISSNN